MSLTTRSVSAATWELGSVIVQAVLQLAFMAILARFISPKDFGLYAIVNTVIAMVLIFSEIGIGSAIVQHKEISEQYLSTAFLLSIFLGALATGLTWLASPAITWFFKQPDVTHMIRVAGLTLFMSAYVTVATSLLERELLYRKLAIINIISYAIGFGLIGIITAILKMGAWAIVIATLSQYIIRAAMLLVTTRVVPKNVFSKYDLKDLLHFGAGISMSRLFNNFAYQVDVLIVGRLMGPTALGLYQMGFQIMDLPRRFLASVIERVMFAALTRIQDDTERMRTGYLQWLELTNVILIPVTVIFIIVAPEAIHVMLGDQWDSLIIPLQILFTTVPLRASVRMGDTIGTAVGKVYNIAVLKIVYALMIAAGVFAGVRWGLVGVTAGITVAVFFNLVIMVWFTTRIVKVTVRDYLNSWLPGCVIGSIAAATTLLGTLVMRNNFESELFRLIVVGSVAGLAILATVWCWPRAAGNTAIRLILHFGRQAGFLPGVFVRLEKRVFGARPVGQI